MRLPALLAALAASLTPFGADTCAAAPFSVPLGDTRVVLDAPPGFSDTTFTGSPRLQELAESFTSPSNRILLFALTDGDLRKFTSGDTPDFRRYMLVVIPKNADRDRVTPEQFQRLASDSMRGMGKPSPDANYAKFLEQQPPNQMVMVAELRKEPTTLTVLQGMRIPGEKKGGMFSAPDPSRYVLTSNTLLLLRGKALNLAVFTLYESPGDAEWIRATTLRWADDLQRLNQR